MMFISSLPHIQDTVHDAALLHQVASISIPTRTAASGTIRETMMVTIAWGSCPLGLGHGAQLLHHDGTLLLEVRAFMMGGWMTGTRAM